MSDNIPPTPSSTPGPAEPLAAGHDESDRWMSDRAKELSEQAKERAAYAREKAGPAAAAAKDRANELADRAAPSVSKGVGALAGRFNKLTKGKYSDKVSAVTSKVEDALDRGEAPQQTAPTAPPTTATPPTAATPSTTATPPAAATPPTTTPSTPATGATEPKPGGPTPAPPSGA